MNDEKLYPFKGEQLTVDKVHVKGQFLSPEFATICMIPANIHYKSWIYSLASLICYYLFDINENGDYKNEDYKNEDYKNEDYKNSLISIYSTKLYWSLSRMLKVNPLERFYLII